MAKILMAAKEQLAEYEKKKTRRREEILNTPNMEIPKDAEVFYLSNNGDDNNDGKTPATAFATLKRFNECGAPEGAYLCLERGSAFRGQLVIRKPLTVTAYGEGPKPQILGSPFDGTKHGSWEEVSKNIWRFSEIFYEDIGMLFINNASVFARKIAPQYCADGKVYDFKTGREWKDHTSLQENLEFVLDFGGPVFKSAEGAYLYFYCDKGNPAEVYENIEFAYAPHTIAVQTNRDVTIDNVCLHYTGGHGVSCASMTNLIVKNCEVGFIGGCRHGYTADGRPIRYGNGIEIYGGCDNYQIDNCWIYECYDAGITHQFFGNNLEMSMIMKNVHYTNNVIERCVYNIEYFNSETSAEGYERYSENVYINNNILTHAGYGFGAQRPDTTVDSHLKSWEFINTQKGDFIIEDNLFMYSNYMMVHTVGEHESDAPTLRNNVFVQFEGGQFGRFGKRPSTVLMYTEETANKEELINNEYYLAKK